MISRLRLAGSLFGLTLLAGAAGCSSHVAAAGAGAGAAYYLTNRGAEGVANGSVDEVARNSVAVMQRLGISTNESQLSQTGDERELTGTFEGEDVTVELERQDDSNVVVEVATDDKDFAQRIVQEIVEFSGSPEVMPADTASAMPSGVSPAPADTTSP